MLNLSGVSKTVIIRAILTVLVAVNIFCGYFGWRLIPVTDTDVAAFVDAGVVIFTAVVWVWGWWKNNSFTVNAQTADELLATLNLGLPEKVE